MPHACVPLHIIIGCVLEMQWYFHAYSLCVASDSSVFRPRCAKLGIAVECLMLYSPAWHAVMSGRMPPNSFAHHSVLLNEARWSLIHQLEAPAR